MTACATGHRSGPKLGGYDNVEVENRIRNTLYQLVYHLFNEGHRKFISGGAIGIDQLFAEAVIHFRGVANNGVSLTIAKPFPSQDNKWPQHVKNRFANICAQANEIVNVSADPYAPWKMQLRNEWMVDKSGVIVAVWDGQQSGGTWNCITYAQAQHKTIYHIQPFGPVGQWTLMEA